MAPCRRPMSRVSPTTSRERTWVAYPRDRALAALTESARRLEAANAKGAWLSRPSPGFGVSSTFPWAPASRWVRTAAGRRPARAYLATTRWPSAKVVGSGTVGPEAMSWGGSPTTSEIASVANWPARVAAPRWPPLIAERWRRRTFIAWIGAPQASRVRVVRWRSRSETPSAGASRIAEPPPEMRKSTTSGAGQLATQWSTSRAARRDPGPGTGCSPYRTSIAPRGGGSPSRRTARPPANRRPSISSAASSIAAAALPNAIRWTRVAPASRITEPSTSRLREWTRSDRRTAASGRTAAMPARAIARASDSRVIARLQREPGLRGERDAGAPEAARPDRLERLPGAVRLVPFGQQVGEAAGGPSGPHDPEPVETGQGIEPFSAGHRSDHRPPVRRGGADPGTRGDDLAIRPPGEPVREALGHVLQEGGVPSRDEPLRVRLHLLGPVAPEDPPVGLGPEIYVGVEVVGGRERGRRGPGGAEQGRLGPVGREGERAA